MLALILGNRNILNKENIISNSLAMVPSALLTTAMVGFGGTLLAIPAANTILSWMNQLSVSSAVSLTVVSGFAGI